MNIVNLCKNLINKDIVIYPSEGLGDLLYITALLPEIRKKNQYSKIKIILSKPYFKDLLYMFDIFYDEIIENYSNIKYKSNVNILKNLCKNPSVHFIDGIKRSLNLSLQSSLYIPELKISKKINEIFKKYELIENKTFIIAPDSISAVEQIADNVWKSYADNLTELGFTCLFNVKNSERFYPYKNLYLNLSETLQLISLGKYFLGYRSGLCDLVAAFTNINQFVVYPNIKNKKIDYPYIKKSFKNFNEDLYEYYSLKYIFNEKNIVEFLYDESTSSINKILLKNQEEINDVL